MKNIFLNAKYNALGFIIPILISLFTTPFIVNKMTPGVYGIYVLSISIMGFMSFMDLGFGQGIIKFISKYDAKKDFDRINDIINVSLIVYIVMGLIGFIILFFLSNILVKHILKVNEQNFAIAVLSFKIVAFGFFINFINGVFSNISKAFQRYDIYNIIQYSIWIVVTLCIVLLLLAGKSLPTILIAYVIVNIIGMILFYAASRKILPSMNIRLYFKKDVFKEIFNFSFFTSMNTLSGSIVVKVDKIIIGGFLGTAAVTYYNIPYIMTQLGSGFIGSITQHLFPGVSYLQSIGDKEKLLELYKQYFKYISAFSLIIVLIFLLVGDNFIKLWMGGDFAKNTINILPILAIVFFFSSITSISLWFYQGLGYSHVNLISSIIGSSCYLLTAFFLIPKYGLKGAAFAFAFIQIPFPVYHYYLLKKVLRFDLKWFIIILFKSILLISVALIIKHFIEINIPSFLILSIFSILIAIVILLLLILISIITLNDIRFLINKIRI